MFQLKKYPSYMYIQFHVSVTTERCKVICVDMHEFHLRLSYAEVKTACHICLIVHVYVCICV